MKNEAAKTNQVDLYEGTDGCASLFDGSRHERLLAEGEKEAILLLAEAYARKGFNVWDATSRRYISGTLDQLLSDA